MKQLFVLLSFVLGAAFMAQGAVGDTFTADGIEYAITSESPAEVAVGANAEFTGSSVVIPASVANGGTTYAVTAVAVKAFMDKISLTSVTLSETIKKIEDHAFRESGIRSIVIPNSVEEIGYYAFLRCPNLKSVKIGNGAKETGWHAFWGCPALETVEIGTGLTKLGYQSFYDCPQLKNVTCLATVPPVSDYGATDIADVFRGTTPLATATLSVPEGSISAYQSAGIWKDFGTIQKYVATGIGNTLSDMGVKLRGAKNGIEIGLSKPLSVSVYTLTGATLFGQTLQTGVHCISVKTGIYLVRINGVTEKVMVRAE